MKDTDKITYANKLMADRREAVNHLADTIDKDQINGLLKSIESLDNVIISIFHPATIPYQCCPKCYGDGNLGRYNSPTLTNSAMPVCDVCHGAKIIPQYVLPNQSQT